VRLAHHDTEAAELGLAPLLDVVLLLLIFFLVTTSFATSRIPLELPGAESAEAPRHSKLVVVLTTDGGLFLDEVAITPALLDGRLAEASHAEPGLDLELRADRAVSHGRVVEILDLARSHGIEAVGIAVAGGAVTPAPEGDPPASSGSMPPHTP